MRAAAPDEWLATLDDLAASEGARSGLPPPELLKSFLAFAPKGVGGERWRGSPHAGPYVAFRHDLDCH